MQEPNQEAPSKKSGKPGKPAGPKPWLFPDRLRRLADVFAGRLLGLAAVEVRHLAISLGLIVIRQSSQSGQVVGLLPQNALEPMGGFLIAAEFQTSHPQLETERDIRLPALPKPCASHVDFVKLAALPRPVDSRLHSRIKP